MKKITTLLAGIALVGSLASCNSSDAPPLDPDTPLYQDYVVESVEGEVTAYASFFKYNNSGERVQLNNGASIKVNGQTMPFFDTYGAAGTFNYILKLPKETTTVEFDFQRNAYKHLITETDISQIPEFTIGSECDTIVDKKVYYASITDGLPYPLIYIQGVLASIDGTKGYNATVDNGGKSFQFVGIKQGIYDLYVTLYTQKKVVANDGLASGSIKTARVVIRRNVIVE